MATEDVGDEMFPGGAPPGVDLLRLREAAGANLVTHFTWLQQRLPGMLALVDEQLAVVDSGLPCDTFNCVCRARLTPETAAGRARETIEHFRREGRPFAWWAGDEDTPADLGDILASNGLTPAETELAMAAELTAVHELSRFENLPAGLRIERARTPEQVFEFARINAANWDPTDELVVRFYEMAAPALLDGNAPIALYVGYLDDEPVATAELTVGGGVAGIYNVSTLATYRRRGIGSMMVRQSLLDARDAGHGVAILHASPMGTGLYERLGFVPTGRVTEYKPTAAASPVCPDPTAGPCQQG